MGVDGAARGVEDAVRAIAADALRSDGLEIVDVEFRREAAGWVLRLFIDKPEGVGLSDCQRTSEVVGTLLEVEDPIPHAYTLEVSSPGLTRPLHREEDWKRAVGRMVRLVTRQNVSGRQDFTGRLTELRPENLVLDVEGIGIEIPREFVVRARMELEWPGAGKAKPGRGRTSPKTNRGIRGHDKRSFPGD